MEAIDLGIGVVDMFLIMGSVIATIEVAKALYDKQWRTAIIILGAALAGGLAGFLTGHSFLVGMVVGLTGSGVITISQSFGKNVNAVAGTSSSVKK